MAQAAAVVRDVIDELRRGGACVSSAFRCHRLAELPPERLLHVLRQPLLPWLARLPRAGRSGLKKRPVVSDAEQALHQRHAAGRGAGAAVVKGSTVGLVQRVGLGASIQQRVSCCHSWRFPGGQQLLRSRGADDGAVQRISPRRTCHIHVRVEVEQSADGLCQAAVLLRIVDQEAFVCASSPFRVASPSFSPGPDGECRRHREGHPHPL
eukprot:scaffold1090_cov265-Pinguiococcus_pyrenoidosus.AAC.33